MINKIEFSPPDISELEIESVNEVLRSGWITTGPKTKMFEQKISEYCGTSKTVCMNSATAAMEVLLHILGVGQGDEVITSAYTYTASASVIYHVGAKIVLVDTYPDSYEMDYDKLADSISEKTKVIIPVDIGGVMCDYNKLFNIIDKKKHCFIPKNNIQKVFNRPIVLADAAHSFGAIYKGQKSGQVADFTAFSFHAVKNLTTAEGGAVTWRDNGLDNNDIYNRLLNYSLHGQTKDALSKMSLGSWEYDILYPAYKCNMTDITAAIGIVQLDRFDNLMARRKEIIDKYNKAFESAGIIHIEHDLKDRIGNGHLYLVRVPGITEQERNNIIKAMANEGVACNVHFKPLPMHTAYINLGFNIADYPNAYNQYSNGITLPLHTKLSNDDVDFVCAKFIEVLKRLIILNKVKSEMLL